MGEVYIPHGILLEVAWLLHVGVRKRFSSRIESTEKHRRGRGRTIGCVPGFNNGASDKSIGKAMAGPLTTRLLDAAGAQRSGVGPYPAPSAQRCAPCVTKARQHRPAHGFADGRSLGGALNAGSSPRASSSLQHFAGYCYSGGQVIRSALVPARATTRNDGAMRTLRSFNG